MIWLDQSIQDVDIKYDNMEKLGSIIEGFFDADASLSKLQDDTLIEDLNWIKNLELKKIIGNTAPCKSQRKYDTILNWAQKLKGSDLAVMDGICDFIENSSLSDEFKSDVFDVAEDEFRNLYIRIGYIRMLEALYTPIIKIDEILKTHKHLKVLKKLWIEFANKDYSKVELTISVLGDQKEEWKNLFDESGIGFEPCDEGFSIICEIKDPYIETLHKKYGFVL